MRDTAGCVGKLAYIDRATAERSRQHLFGKRGFKHDGAMRAYCCPNCGRFHLGRDRRAGRTATVHSDRRKHDGLLKLQRYLELTRER
jgi:predicted RNA-binding Zn-ribbon protein involved in translation (DUF1610 family)